MCVEPLRIGRGRLRELRLQVVLRAVGVGVVRPVPNVDEVEALVSMDCVVAEGRHVVDRAVVAEHERLDLATVREERPVPREPVEVAGDSTCPRLAEARR